MAQPSPSRAAQCAFTLCEASAPRSSTTGRAATSVESRALPSGLYGCGQVTVMKGWGRPKDGAGRRGLQQRGCLAADCRHVLLVVSAGPRGYQPGCRGTSRTGGVYLGGQRPTTAGQERSWLLPSHPTRNEVIMKIRLLAALALALVLPAPTGAQEEVKAAVPTMDPVGKYAVQAVVQ